MCQPIVQSDGELLGNETAILTIFLKGATLISSHIRQIESCRLYYTSKDLTHQACQMREFRVPYSQFVKAECEEHLSSYFLVTLSLLSISNKNPKAWRILAWLTVTPNLKVHYWKLNGRCLYCTWCKRWFKAKDYWPQDLSPPPQPTGQRSDVSLTLNAPSIIKSSSTSSGLSEDHWYVGATQKQDALPPYNLLQCQA